MLRTEIIGVLFQRGRFDANDTAQTAYALLFYAVGLFFFAAVKVFAPSFYAYQDTVTPVKVGVVVFLFHIGLNFLLIGPLRHGGMALSTTLSAVLNVSLLAFLFIRRRGPLRGTEIFGSLARAAMAAAVMGTGIGVLRMMWEVPATAGFGLRAAQLGTLIGSGVVVFLLAAIGLGCPELREITRSFARAPGAGGSR
jgi:putative peptidoglycan lipid II flippase